jgi:hypothetical protein
MVISSITGVTSPVNVTEIPKVETEAVKEITRKEVENIMSTEQYVKQYFSDIPIMIQIAKCESRFRQLDADGDIHRGEINSEDVGVMQINEHYHLNQSIKNDFDIYTIEGNTAYARNLYERQGTQPWASSRGCWGKYEKKNLAINVK